MDRFYHLRKFVIAMAIFATVLTPLGQARAQVKDKDQALRIKLRIEITGVPGDGAGGSIDAFGSEQLLTQAESDTGGGGAGKADFGPVVITKDVDSATPKLLVKSASGAHIPLVRIHWIRKNPLTGLEDIYFTAQLEDVLITTFRVRLADQRDPQSEPGSAVENVGFTFAKIRLFFFRPDGTVVSGGYDSKGQAVIN